MPSLTAILALYRAVFDATLSGALTEECVAATQAERARVARQFLTGAECHEWRSLAPTVRAARLRKGEHRFREWEAANPDVVAVLQRKAAPLD